MKEMYENYLPFYRKNCFADNEGAMTNVLS